MKKLIMCIYLLLFSVIFANFQVAPQVQQIDLERAGTQKIYLKNDTNKLKKIKIYSERPKDQKTKDLYMGDWIIVYPKIVYLKPNSKKVIRMAARPPQNLVDGEYRSHLVFEEIPVKKYDTSEKNDDNVEVNLDIIHILVSTVYGYSGELKYSGTFDDFNVIVSEDKTYLGSKIINTGTTALDIVYKTTYYNNIKTLEMENLFIGKVMRENYRNSVIELNKIPEDANNIKIEYYYRVKKDVKTLEEGEAEYEEFKVGEKLMAIKKISSETYLKMIEEEKLEEEK